MESNLRHLPRTSASFSTLQKLLTPLCSLNVLQILKATCFIVVKVFVLRKKCFCCRTLVRCRYLVRFVIIYCKWYQLEPMGIYNRLKLWLDVVHNSSEVWMTLLFVFCFLVEKNRSIPQLISKRQSITDQLQTWGCFHISYRLRVICIIKDPTVTVKCRTAIKPLLSFFNLRLRVKLDNIIHLHPVLLMYL